MESFLRAKFLQSEDLDLCLGWRADTFLSEEPNLLFSRIWRAESFSNKEPRLHFNGGKIVIYGKDEMIKMQPRR